MAEIELLRALRPVLDRLVEPRFYIPVGTRRKLKTWAEATLKHRPPGNRETP